MKREMKLNVNTRMLSKNKYDYNDLFHEIGKGENKYDLGTPDKFFKREKYLFGLLGKKGEEITNGIIYRKNDLGLIDWELCYSNSLKEYEKTWYKNGKLCSESYYKDGILTERKEYYENGQLKNEKQPNGNKKYYHENGELDGEYLIIENKIINNQQVYYHKKYSENGVLMYEGEQKGKSFKSFSGGIQIGLWKLYNEEGKLKTKVTYDNFGETKKEEVVDDKNDNLSNEEI